jgi:hypothetical protein
MRLKTFEQFVNEALESHPLQEDNDFLKIYIALGDDDLDTDEFSYKKFCSSNFFKPLTPLTEDFDPDLPILNYKNSTINHFWGEINKDNVYNLPKYVEEVAQKERFHQIVGVHENVPLTMFTKPNALRYLRFPVIAKPSDNHSGMGIQVFKNAEELQGTDDDFAVYSEFIEKTEEHRFVIFKGKLIAWLARVPVNDRAKTGTGDKDEEMKFAYEYKTSELPIEYEEVINKFVALFPDLPYMTLDIMKGADKKIYVIEVNSKAGMPFDITTKLYRCIFEDFYGRKMKPDSDKNLEMIAVELNQKTLDKDKNFKIERYAS